MPQSTIEMPFQIPPIPHVRLRATFRARGEGRLPPLHGSMLRGAFGHALRRATCSMDLDDPCEACLLRGPCLYTRLFETFLDPPPFGRETPPFLRGLATGPRPYVVEQPGLEESDGSDLPPLRGQRVRSGDRLEADLVLVGQAVALQPYAVLALGRMAPVGLGEDRIPFALEAVDARAGEESSGAAWQPVLVQGDGGRPALHPAPARQPEPIPTTDHLTLRFLTPTRILKKGEPLERLTFRQLTFAMVRRVLEMAHVHVPPTDGWDGPSWDFKDLLTAASEVRITGSTLTWHHSERASSRQRRRHTTAGFRGDLHLQGPLDPFLPLLAAARVLHVGKGATFGLGHFQVLPGGRG